jgi:hypothetical protein
MTPPPDKEVYLGDGCFASFDGWSIWLRTQRDDGVDHLVALDPQVFWKLRDYAKAVWGDCVRS